MFSFNVKKTFKDIQIMNKHMWNYVLNQKCYTNQNMFYI